VKSRAAAATDAARRLWARSAGDARTPEQVAAAAELMCDQLRTGLGRWIGAQGYRALLGRAHGLVRGEHPALDGLGCLEGEQAQAIAAVRKHGAADVADGLMALVATLIELLGRIIGDEMAVRLVEQTCPLTPRGVMDSEARGGRDG
jgi:hypothetical protein